jgi:hypothetical protein
MKKTKRTVRPCIQVALALVTIVILVSFIYQPYKMNGTVIEDSGSAVVVRTTNGHEWIVNVDPFSFQEGDEVVVEFEDGGNPNRQIDDRIVDIYKK